jgi:hypothetical protein
VSDDQGTTRPKEQGKTANEKEQVAGAISDRDLDTVAGGVDPLAPITALATSLAGVHAPLPPLKPGK